MTRHSTGTKHVLELRFHTTARGHPLILKARGGFRVVGPLLVQWPENEISARYARHCWHLDGHDASGFECNHYASLRFTDSRAGDSEVLGPFDHLNFSNGYCYADQILVAELITETERWRHCETGLRWQAIVISPAAGGQSVD